MQKVLSAKKLGENSLYYFTYDVDVKTGDYVVVEFEEFQTIAKVEKLDEKISKPAEDFGKVTRIASEADLKKFDSLAQKAKKELPLFKKKSLELGLMMKFVDAEYSLDGSKILIVFSSEERVDFRQLLKDLATMLKTRIELKQIGQRDEVKLVGGVGPCGEPCCCARFLKDFEHVTVKMAKIQSLSLAPTKINGVCGRLMCCLGYESQMYEEQLAKMPKINSEVKTPNGKGVVVYNDILRERVSVKRQTETDTIVIEEFELNDIEGFGSKEKTDAKKEENKKENNDASSNQTEREKRKNENNSFKNNDKNAKNSLKNNQKPELLQKNNDEKREPFEMILGGENKVNSQNMQNNSTEKDKRNKNHHKRNFFKNKKK